MSIDVICSLGSDVSGRVVEDTSASSCLPERHRVWVCTQVELETVLETVRSHRGTAHLCFEVAMAGAEWVLPCSSGSVVPRKGTAT